MNKHRISIKYHILSVHLVVLFFRYHMIWDGFSSFYVGCANKNDTTDVTKIRNFQHYIWFFKNKPKYGV